MFYTNIKHKYKYVFFYADNKSSQLHFSVLDNFYFMKEKEKNKITQM